ncbi:AraC-like DNA-binding protein [Rhizobium giardinii]|uniref:AraC-like DNA-binding protein n=1 Tax=Rhizobium giardinii TaxID=56731 RepID=A0A7W8U697_9HYPH|nr:AraC-like DNA-binding protein [Rhizobium giardinii]
MTEIMFEAGFSTKSNFNREFRRVTGVSPSHYRAEARKQQVADPKAKT